MVRLSASEVARHFSDVLNRVATGEKIEVTRGGAPVAVIAPLRTRLLTAASFRDLLAAAPPIDDEFAGDVRTIRAAVGAAESPKPS